MFRHSKRLLGLTAMAGLVACTSGQSAQVPPFSSANLTQSVAKLAVGTATFGTGQIGTNIVATFRQPNGDSATLVNTPSITGPAGWTVPNCPFPNTVGSCTVAGGSSSGQNVTLIGGPTGVDAGTTSITASPQIPAGVTSPTAVPDTLQQSGGVFSYGIQPDNAGTTGAPVFNVYNQPFFATATAVSASTGIATSSTPTQNAYRGGPPAYPNVRDGTFPNGFFGYSQGFLTTMQPPVAGSYTLSILVQTSTGTSQTFSANAAMTNTAGLGVIGPPTVTQDGNGGLSSITFTAPVGVTQTLVDVVDFNWCNSTIGNVSATPIVTYYTVVARGSGPQTVSLPANIGPTGTSAASCPTPGRTIVSGDTYRVFLVGADYPAFEAGPPQNTSLSPTIVGANGQADVTLSTRLTAVY